MDHRFHDTQGCPSTSKAQHLWELVAHGKWGMIFQFDELGFSLPTALVVEPRFPKWSQLICSNLLCVMFRCLCFCTILTKSDGHTSACDFPAKPTEKTFEFRAKRWRLVKVTFVPQVLFLCMGNYKCCHIFVYRAYKNMLFAGKTNVDTFSQTCVVYCNTRKWHGWKSNYWPMPHYPIWWCTSTFTLQASKVFKQHS